MWAHVVASSIVTCGPHRCALPRAELQTLRARGACGPGYAPSTPVPAHSRPHGVPQTRGLFPHPPAGPAGLLWGPEGARVSLPSHGPWGDARLPPRAGRAGSGARGLGARTSCHSSDSCHTAAAPPRPPGSGSWSGIIRAHGGFCTQSEVRRGAGAAENASHCYHRRGTPRSQTSCQGSRARPGPTPSNSQLGRVTSSRRIAASSTEGPWGVGTSAGRPQPSALGARQQLRPAPRLQHRPLCRPSARPPHVAPAPTPTPGSAPGARPRHRVRGED